MNPLKLGLIVEGHGEVRAAPILVRRIADNIDRSVVGQSFCAEATEQAMTQPGNLQPIRRPRRSLVKPSELERAVELAVREARPREVFSYFRTATMTARRACSVALELN